MRAKVMLCAAAVIVVGATPAQAAFPGHNGKIAFESDRSGNFDIWTMSPNGRNLRNLTAGYPGVDETAAWSPDGRTIVFESTAVGPANPTGDQELYLMNADGSHRRQITFNDLDDGIPNWSPDGERIIFHRWFGDFDSDLFTMRRDGSDERNVTRSPGVMDRQGAWSPDGRVIAFSHGGDDSGEVFGDIYTIRPDGTHLRQLTSTVADAEYPDWSPDGRQIAFISDRAVLGQFDVFTMRPDGGSVTRVTYAECGAPAWSPDGRKLACGSNRSGDSDIWTMRSDGTRPRNRTESPLSVEGFPDWQPLGQQDRAEEDDD